MNYFERCKKRIECAVQIDWSFSRTFNYTQRFIVDEVLKIRKTEEIDFNILYLAQYKETNIPMSQEECETLFNLAHEKLKELEAIKDEQILEEL
jgi:hypothetical protein